MIFLRNPRITFRFLLVLVFCFSAFTHGQEAYLNKNWPKPVPIFKQKYDWLGLTSDEWLKGDIIAMYDEELEFDSDEMGIVTIDMDDVSELRSKGRQSVRLENGYVLEGYLVIREGKLTMRNSIETVTVPVTELLSIASSSDYEWDLWDGEISLGANLRGGNAEQFDYNFYAEVQRRTSTSRIKSTLTVDFSESKNQDTGDNETIADSQRFTAFYDWFFSQKMFFRAVDFTYFSDEFQNIDQRYTLGSSLGYHLIDTKRTTWDVTLGPSYQYTKFKEIDVVARNAGQSDSEKSAVILIGSEYEYEITKDIDFEILYEVQIVEEAAGEYIHHLMSSLEIELINDFDLDLAFFLDRTQKPQPDEDGELPEKDDYRFVVGLSYDF